MGELKKLGEYIRQVDVRNRDLFVDRLLGLSINKCFIESIANTIGTDFKSYKIVRKGQFAYGPVTSRNGEKLRFFFEENKVDNFGKSVSKLINVYDLNRIEIEKPEQLK